MPRPTERVAALVLRSVDYGDADRILTLLTREAGVVSVLARGVRRPSRRFPGGVPSLALLEAEIALGRGEVGRLAEASPVRSFPGLLVDLDRLSGAGAALETTRRLLPPRQPEPEVFATAVELLEALEAAPSARSRALVLGFRARVSAIVGLEPALDRCALCGRAPKPGQAALFDPAAGGLVCRACGGGPLRLTSEAREAWITAATPRWKEAVGPPVGPAALALVESALDAFLDWHTGRRRSGGNH